MLLMSEQFGHISVLFDRLKKHIMFVAILSGFKYIYYTVHEKSLYIQMYVKLASPP